MCANKKIILVHNYYQQFGGEDAVVETERTLLRSRGNVVVSYCKTNDDIGASGNRLLAIGSLLKASITTLWNHQTYREFRKLLQNEKPDVVHCHNTFPLISPSIYWACAKERVPVVQTLHNYRLLCVNAVLFLQSRHSAAGGICELCVSKRFKWPGIKYSCYRDSKAGSLVVALMLFIHKLAGTWSKKVTSYIALTELQKQKMIEGGLPEDKIWVKPNFIDGSSIKEPTANSHVTSAESLVPNAEQNYALFVGRLSPEKGCDVLIRAWAQFKQKPTANETPQLLIVGDGLERAALESLTSSFVSNAESLMPSTIHFLGQQPKESVLVLMRNAQFLVFSSIWYETFGLTVLEAGLEGTPSVVSAPTTTSGLISDRQNGLVYPLGDDAELAEKIEWAFDHPAEMKKMGEAARLDFEQKYSAEVNYEMLTGIYDRALGDGR